MIIVAAVCLFVCLLHELHELCVLKHELIYRFEQINYTLLLLKHGMKSGQRHSPTKFFVKSFASAVKRQIQQYIFQVFCFGYPKN